MPEKANTWAFKLSGVHSGFDFTDNEVIKARGHRGWATRRVVGRDACGGCGGPHWYQWGLLSFVSHLCLLKNKNYDSIFFGKFD